MTIQQMLLGGSGESGYNLTRSLRFRASASARLNRAFSSGNQVLWTWSSWVKRGTLGTYQVLFGVQVDGNTVGTIGFDSDKLAVINKVGGSTGGAATTNAVFRDPSAWYHIVVAYNGNGAAATDKFKLYVNSVLQTFSATENYSTGNGYINSNVSHGIGRRDTLNDAYFDGYLAEVNFIDGQALTPASFGSTNATTGVWQPAPYTGTYGTNGFYLKFTDNSTAAALGTDFSGNSNTWTVNNISVTAGVTYDSMTDVPTLTNATTANYAVWNRIFNPTNQTVTNGNLAFSATGSNPILSTVGMTSGKYYAEFVWTAGETFMSIGIANDNLSKTNYVGSDTNGFGLYSSNGSLYYNGTAYSYGSAFPSNAIIMVAFDVTNGKIWWGVNGTWINSGDPAAGTNPGVAASGATINVSLPSATWFFGSGTTGQNGCSANFGQRPFAYTPPTGFVALNTFNLPASTIVKGNTVMDATLWTGNGAARSITNAAGFYPDLVWIKDRSVARSHRLFDTVRGATKGLFSDSTDAEATLATDLTAFNSNGFALGVGLGSNASAETYVGWQWQAGQGSSSSNTNGSITSTVSVNASAGFSVVTYTGTNTGTPSPMPTVGHGLGVAPSLVISKSRNLAGVDSGAWFVWTSAQATDNYLRLNTTAASASISGNGGGTMVAPTSSVFSTPYLSGSNINANTYVAYCWSEIDGFSKFGSYTGNGSADGPMIYTGFKPRFVMIKRTDSTSNWYMFDTARNTFNVMTDELLANSTNADANNNRWIDVLSNGFKIRNDAVNQINASGGTMIYMAFAENPFRNSLAR
jgi:hypothetical protein